MINMEHLSFTKSPILHRIQKNLLKITQGFVSSFYLYSVIFSRRHQTEPGCHNQNDIGYESQSLALRSHLPYTRCSHRSQ